MHVCLTTIKPCVPQEVYNVLGRLYSCFKVVHIKDGTIPTADIGELPMQYCKTPAAKVVTHVELSGSSDNEGEGEHSPRMLFSMKACCVVYS